MISRKQILDIQCGAVMATVRRNTTTNAARRMWPDRRDRREPPVYARLPRAPKNASPVPELTSLYHKSDPGHYGSRRYPGNCPGNFIKDLLRYFQPRNVMDPLCGASHKGSSVAEWVMWCRA